MSCVPVCVRNIIFMIVCNIVICATLATELWVVWKYDNEWQNTWMTSKKRWMVCFGSSMVLCSIHSCQLIPNKKLFILFLFGIIMGSLFMAAVTDHYFCLVYCFVWWIAGAAECIWILVKGQNNLLESGMGEVVLFCLLQELLFGRVYGRADCHAFCVSALLLWNFGGDMKIFLIHMVVSFSVLAIVQALRKNINRRGNLKQPVAFVPYIVFALCLLLGTI